MSLVLVLSLLTAAPPTEALLLEDAKDGVLDTVSFSDAALLASGVLPSELDAARATLTELLEPARKTALEAKDPEQRARRLLEALHDRVFRQYRLEATTLPELWRTGEFNCLSSSVAYVIAADGLLERARGVLSVRHALVQVTVNGKPFDVQTTVRSGFGMARKQMLSAQYLSRVARPGEDLARVEREILDAEEVPVLSLIAGLYANRAVLAMAQGTSNAEADALFDRAGQLSVGKSKQRFGVWRAAFVNDSARELAKVGRYQEALHLVERVMDSAGEVRGVLKHNVGVFRLELANEARRRNDWVEVLAHADAARVAGLEDAAALVSEAKGMLAAQRGACDGSEPKERLTCLVTLSSAKVKAGDRAAALAAARQALALAPADPSAMAAVYEVEVGRLGELAASGDDCDEAATLAHQLEALARGFSREPWSGNGHVFACFAARGAQAFEQKRYEQAGAAYRRALQLEPTNAAARQNAEASDYNLATSFSREGRCDDARAVLGRGVARGQWVSVLEPCWVNVTARLGREKAWLELATQARHGLVDVPTSEALQHNLGVAVKGLAVDAANAGRCAEVVGLLPEVRALDAALAGKLEARCPRATR